MAERDIYAPCICGSGKKLKFCCLPVVAELERLRKLMGEERFELVLTAASELLKNPRATPSARSWAHTIRAKILKSTDPQQALAELDASLREVPDNRAARVERLTIQLETTPPAELAELIDELLLSFDLDRENNRSDIARFEQFFSLTTSLLTAHHNRDEKLATYVCLDLLRRNLDESNLDLIEKLVRQFPPLPYALQGDCYWPFQGDERFRVEFETATHSALCGAYFDAARRFGDLARQQPQNATFLFNSGVSLVYAGESAQAVEVLQSVARMNIDFESAVECEILAWSVEEFSSNSPTQTIVEQTYEVDNALQVLGILDSQPTLHLVNAEPASRSSEGIKLPREYKIIDRPIPDSSPLSWTAEETPVEIGSLRIGAVKSDTSGSDETRPMTVRLLINFKDTPEAHAFSKSLEQELGNSVRLHSTTSFKRAALLDLPYLVIPEIASYAEKFSLLRLNRQRLLQTILHKDYAPPLLRGQTLAELAQQPDQKVRLAAVLFLIAQQSGFFLDVDDLRQRFGLPVTERLHIPEDTEPDNLTDLQRARLDLADLTDMQCYEALNVYQTTRFPPGIYQAGVECFTREFADVPPALQLMLRKAIALTLSENRLLQGHFEEALAWITKARQYVDPNNRVKENFPLDLFEVKIRAANPADPHLIPRAQALWRLAKTKLPETIKQLQAHFLHYNIPGEWDPTSLVSATGEALTSQGPASLWTPDSEAGTSTGKLWLPGQE